MKVLVVTPFYPPDIGGISYHVKHLTENLIEMGVEVEILTASKRSQNPIDGKVPVTKVRCAYPPRWPLETLTSMSIPLDLAHLKNKLGAGDFDVLHLHGHHYPIIWLSTQFGSRKLLTLHGTYALDPRKMNGKSLIEEMFNRSILRWVLNRTQGVVGLTNTVSDYARRYGTSSLKYYTISNGVNVNLFSKNAHRKTEYRTKYRIPVDNKVFLFAGRFTIAKGLLEYSKAILRLKKILSNSTFLFVGSGPLYSQIHTLLSGTDNIIFLPWIDESEIHEVFIASDAFVLPSRWEALPLAIIQAVAANLHIIATSVGGVPDALQGYESKQLIVDLSELEDAIVSADRRLDGHERRKRSALIRNYDWSVIAKEYLDVYTSMLDNSIGGMR